MWGLECSNQDFVSVISRFPDSFLYLNTRILASWFNRPYLLLAKNWDHHLVLNFIILASFFNGVPSRQENMDTDDLFFIHPAAKIYF